MVLNGKIDNSVTTDCDWENCLLFGNIISWEKMWNYAEKIDFIKKNWFYVKKKRVKRK